MPTLTVVHGDAAAREHALSHSGADVKVGSLTCATAAYVRDQMALGATVAVGVAREGFQEAVQRVAEVLGAEAAADACYVTRTA